MNGLSNSGEARCSSSLDTAAGSQATTTSRHHDIPRDDADANTSNVAASTMIPGDLRGASRLVQKPRLVPASSMAGMNAGSRRKLEQEFTMDKLRFKKVGLVGRDAEIQTLQEAFRETLRETEPTSSFSTTASSIRHHSATKTSSRCRAVVLIEGAAGTGKSSLARYALQSLVEGEAGGFFIRGKHKLQLQREGGGDGDSPLQPPQQQQHLKPYEGISECCEDLCAQMLKKYSPENLREIQTTFQTKLGVAEVLVLTSVLPSLQKLLVQSDGNCTTTTCVQLVEKLSSGSAPEHSGDGEYLKLKQRFSYAFGRFLGILCEDVAPTVMLLEDLQWCDESSFNLLESVLHDKYGVPLMIVGTFLGEEMKNDHLLRLFETKVKSLIEQRNQIHMSHICLGDLTLDATIDLLVELLSLDNSERALPLAKCVHAKTRGNAFFMVQFITSLHQQGLLEFNYGLLKWMWDLDKIERETTATDNVAELVRLKLANLTPHLGRIVLPLMASLGSVFHTELFQMVLHHIQTNLGLSDSSNKGGIKQQKQESPADSVENNEDYSSMAGILATCEKEGLIEPFFHGKNTSYRWIHDKVEEAALTMVSQERIELMQFDLGTSLLEQMTEEQIEENIFVLVYLFRTCSHRLAPKDPKRMRIAKLKLVSGRQAFRASAFTQAADELQMGIDLLFEHSWDKDYQFCLELYSTAAEANLCIAKFGVVDKFVAEIVKHTSKKPLIDRRRAYNVQVRRHLVAGQLNKAVTFLLTVLPELGVKIRNRGVKLRVASNVLSAQKNAKANVQAFVELLPAKNELVGWATFLLDRLTSCLYLMKDSRYALSIFKSMELTLKYGTNPITPAIVASIGLMCAVELNDHETGSIYAIEALELSKKMSVKFTEARTCFLAYTLILHQTKPIDETKKGLLKGYQSGRANGDTEFSLWCMSSYIVKAFLAGTVLELLVHDCEAYIHEVKELELPTHAYAVECVWQSALNLQGKSRDPLVLTGEAMSEEGWLKKNVLGRHWELQMRKHQVHLAVIMGSYERAMDIILSHAMDENSFEKAFAGGYPNILLHFHIAIAGASMARQSRSRSRFFSNMTRKFGRKIIEFSEKGNPNVHHQAALIKAELADLKGDTKNAHELFQRAITISARSGFRQDRALAHERYGDFYLRQRCQQAANGGTESAHHHYQEAMLLYEELGAMAKVRRLREQRKGVVSKTS